MGTIIVIHPQGTMQHIRQEERPTLRQLQGWVGGYIEPVYKYLPEGMEAWVDEDGISKGLPPNNVGTLAVEWPHMLLGNVVVVQGFPPEEEGEVDFDEGDA